jgi:hypothetical protein
MRNVKSMKAADHLRNQLKRRAAALPEERGVIPVAPTPPTNRVTVTKRHHIVRTSLCLTPVEQQKLEEMRMFLYSKGSGLVSTTTLLQIAIRSLSIGDELVDIASAIKAEDRRRTTK